MYGLSLFAQFSFAAVHSTPYLAMHVTPKYAQLHAMPYANPNAPKGGVLSQSSLGTFDNLNSMNGKGSATEGVNYLFDTLIGLASKYGMEINALAEMNDLTPKTQLRIGDVIKVPNL